MSAIIKPASIVPPLRSSKAAVDINGFFEIVGQALAEYIKTEGAPAGTAPFYTETFPKQRLTKPDTPFDAILWTVEAGGMAPTSNDGTVVPREPSLRQVYKKQDEAGYNQVVNAWWETYTVQFEIWSKSNPYANQLAVWFHRFLIRYAYVYKFFGAFGIQQFRYVARKSDAVETRENQELYVRRLQYSFRLELLDSFKERQLTDLTLNIGVNRDREVQTIEIPTAQ
jgi:hypothetical protein